MLEWMRIGGPMAWLILLAGIAAAAVFIERMLYLRRAQILPQDFLKGIFNVVRRQNIAEAVSLCDETPGPVARMVRSALLNHDGERETVRRAMIEAGMAEIPRLERRMGVLAVVSRLAPTLGLLGTVLSLMDSLLVMQRGAPLVHAGDLTGSLWRALVCTAAGLATAIPCFAAYNLLVGRVESILLDMERAVGEVLDQLAQERRRLAGRGE